MEKQQKKKKKKKKEIGIHSLLVLGLTLPVFTRVVLSSRARNTIWAVGTLVGEGPRAGQGDWCSPSFHPQLLLELPSQLEPSGKLSHMSSVNVEVGGWPWRWW